MNGVRTQLFFSPAFLILLSESSGPICYVTKPVTIIAATKTPDACFAFDLEGGSEKWRTALVSMVASSVSIKDARVIYIYWC